LLADVDLAGRNDAAIALDTLSILTGVVVIAAGFLRLGRFPHFVSTAVMADRDHLGELDGTPS
jgi:MFS superfamily sulfate permease-like transporter